MTRREMTLNELVVEILNLFPDARLAIDDDDEIIIRPGLWLGPDESVVGRGRTIPVK